MAKIQRWQFSALTLAIAVGIGSVSTEASALALGRVNVLSALGEPLRAEIDVPQISAEEAESLQVNPASPDAFKAAGLDYNAAVSTLRISLQRRADGTSFLRVQGDRVVDDPFVDLIVEATWSAGRVVRDYTLLLDPPSLRQAIPAITQAQISPPAAGTSVPAVTAPVRPSASARPPAPAATPRPTPAPASAAAPSPAAPSTPSSATTTTDKPPSVTVAPGDTAGRIAARVKPVEVSLDQMLVALLKANPDAFIAGNVNRLRAGSVLDVPTSADALATPPDEATRTVVAQSNDFNAFRQRLAAAAPSTAVAQPDRAASGRVQAQVQERAPAATAPDKLTLSAGQVQAGSADQIARQRQARDEAARVAELSRNVADLNKLGAAVPGAAPAPAAPGLRVPAAAPAALPAPAPAPAAAAAPPAPAAPTPPVAPAPATPVAAATAASAPPTTAAVAAAVPTASAPAAAPSPAAAAQPAPAPKPPVVVAPPPPLPEPSLLDDLLTNPMVPLAAGGLLALLAGLALYKVRQRRKAPQVDSSFLESRLQPDSFFGASGGQRVDTNDSSATGSSMVYSPSQLDAAGDVDPVAEADVYLAYGRDMQAEEILKEAIRTNPSRVAVHVKLLEIYAKRRDVKAFEAVAGDAYALTRGVGLEWEQICTFGRDLDPGNGLYQPGGQPGSPSNMATVGMAAMTQPSMAQPDFGTPSGPVDLELDLDFSADPAPSRPQAASLDLPVPTLPQESGSTPFNDRSGETTSSMQATDSVLDSLPVDLDFDPSPPPARSAPQAPSTSPSPLKAAESDGLLEFDLGSLSLDLEETTRASSLGASGSSAGVSTKPGALDGDSLGDDPLATKLALAEEFFAIGDSDGARALVEEVVSEASGALKAKAERFLTELV